MGQPIWYLGLDIGTTAIAAVLFNRMTGQLHPLSWPHSPAPGGSLVPPLYSFKPYLNAAIPYYFPQTHEWEPKIPRSTNQTIPLAAVKQALVALLAPLAQADCTATGLDVSTLNQVMKHLAGVVLSCPVGASDAYCFNLREVVLAAGLVPHPEQIFLIEEAISALLPELHPTQQVSGTVAASTLPSASNAPPTVLPETVLVISAGATSTDLLLANLPADPEKLQRSDMALRRCSYAGNALDQDMICQLLYPLRNRWPELPDLPIPLAGEPDLEIRYQLQQYLEQSAAGQQLLAQARPLKLKLIQGDATFTWGEESYSLQQSDFLNWVILPYLQQLHRELSLLLLHLDLNREAIRRVICTGGTASIPAIAESLQQKFPAAQIIQDAALADGSSQPSHQRISSGLSLLPQFPKTLDSTRHQYSELFLLRELLRVLRDQPEHPLSPNHILQLLKQQGIKTDLCETTILNFLDGQLPAGLVPGRVSALLFGTDSQSPAKAMAHLATPLFAQQDNQLYQVVPKQRDRLWAYLQIILANTQQKLTQPLAVNLLPSQQSSHPVL